MIDFHSHIVYDVDDGSENIDNSIELLKQAEQAGFKSIILTPHYMEDYYKCSKNIIKDKIEILKEKCNEEKININLYQANEIYITNHMVDLLNNEIASSINNSKYVLFELPMNEEPQNLLEVVYNLIENGKTPIIAHPERYIYIQKDPNKLIELIDLGVLFQANYGSIIGLYGKEIQKTVKLLLKNNFIHFLGTDEHRSGKIYINIENVKKELRKILSEETIQNIIENNAKKVLENQNIEIEQPTLIKQNFLTKIFN